MPQNDLTCARCGYVCNYSESLEDPSAVPQQGDITICINCGLAYILQVKNWVPMSDKDIAHLSPEARSCFEAFQRARRFVITEDLALNQKLRTTK